MLDEAKNVPIELKKALRGLDDDIRLAIFLTLRNHEELSFSELGEKIGMKDEKAKMQFHLRKLTESALVEHKFKHQLGNDKFSYYCVTKFGDNLWKNIIDSLKPPPPIQSMYDTSGKYQTDITDITDITFDYSNASFTVNSSMPMIQTSKPIRKRLPGKASAAQYEVAKVGGEE